MEHHNAKRDARSARIVIFGGVVAAILALGLVWAGTAKAGGHCGVYPSEEEVEAMVLEQGGPAVVQASRSLTGDEAKAFLKATGAGDAEFFSEAHIVTLYPRSSSSTFFVAVYKADGCLSGQAGHLPAEAVAAGLKAARGERS